MNRYTQVIFLESKPSRAMSQGEEKPRFEIRRDKPPMWDEVHAFLGGYVERLELPTGAVLVVDEDGLLKSLPRNEEATEYARMSGYPVDAVTSDGYLVGNVMAIEGAAAKGWRERDGKKWQNAVLGSLKGSLPRSLR